MLRFDWEIMWSGRRGSNPRRPAWEAGKGQIKSIVQTSTQSPLSSHFPAFLVLCLQIKLSRRFTQFPGDFRAATHN
jgi:hypothetical protein